MLLRGIDLISEIFPQTKSEIEEARASGYSFFPKTNSWIKDVSDQPAAGLRARRSPVAEYGWLGHSVPHDHQREGLSLMMESNVFLLDWEMGCGKTAPACNRIAIALSSRQVSRAIVVCPKSVMRVWPNELFIHGGITKDRICVLSGTPKQRKKILDSNFDVMICGYETARDSVVDLLKIGFGMIVLDEAHRIKNMSSKTFKAMVKLGDEASFRYALTGTPITNSPVDICGTLSFLDKSLLGTRSKTAIYSRYVIMNPNRTGHIVGYRNLSEISEKAALVSSRKRKSDCVSLPDKIITRIPVEMAGKQLSVYKKVRDDCVAEFELESKAGTLSVSNVLSMSMRLLQITGGFVADDDGGINRFPENPKIEIVKDMVSDLDGKAIIWCQFIHEAQEVFDHVSKLAGSVIHHGRIGYKERQESIDKFLSDPDCRILVSTSPSAREGLTFTVANTNIYYSRGWNLLDWLQSQDRSHRIGQQKSVNIYCLVAAESVDVKVDLALERKQGMHDMIMSPDSFF